MVKTRRDIVCFETLQRMHDFLEVKVLRFVEVDCRRVDKENTPVELCLLCSCEHAFATSGRY